MGLFSVFKKNRVIVSNDASEFDSKTSKKKNYEVMRDILELFSIYQKPVFRSHIVKHLIGKKRAESDNSLDKKILDDKFEKCEYYKQRELNKIIFSKFPDSLMIAEESSEWPLVSAPVHLGGLGFNFKWNMGWMNDMLEYMEKDSIYRKWHHNLITFSFLYAFSENFILPLSHDEVVYGKKSLLNKMPGDYWQKFANLRVLYGYMMTHPGKKLLFMGGEFAQFDEWKDQEDLDWHLLDYELHAKMKNYVKQLNHFYLNEPGLWELDHEQEGFHWIDPHNNQQSIIVFMRKGKKSDDYVISICNFTPEYYPNYKIGVPEPGTYREVFNSDLEEYGGSGKVNRGSLFADKSCWHNQPCHLEIEIPPLTTVILKKIINSE